MSTLESLVVGFIAGVVTAVLALLLAIVIFLDGGNGELGGFTQGLFDFVLRYFDSHPNAFLIGFLLGLSTTVGGGATASRN